MLGSRASANHGAIGYYTPLAFAGSVVYAVPFLLMTPIIFSRRMYDLICSRFFVSAAYGVALIGSAMALSFDYEGINAARAGSLLVACAYAIVGPSLCRAFLSSCKMRLIMAFCLAFGLSIIFIFLNFFIEKIINISIIPIYNIIICFFAIRITNTKNILLICNQIDIKRLILDCLYAICCGTVIRCLFNLLIGSALNRSSFFLSDILCIMVGIAIGIFVILFIRKGEIASSVSYLLFGMMALVVGVSLEDSSNEAHLVGSILFSLTTIVSMHSLLSRISLVHRDMAITFLPILTICQFWFISGFLSVPTLEFIMNISIMDSKATEHLCGIAIFVCASIVTVDLVLRYIKRNIKKEKNKYIENIYNNLFILVAKKWSLTSRETEILSELFRGRTAKGISGRLSISINTVRSHIKHVYTKTGVHSQQELIDLIDALSDDEAEHLGKS